MSSKSNSKTIDMGQRNVKSLVLKLAIPTVVSQLIIVLYTIVDRIYIGHIPNVGTDVLTGVGVCLPAITLALAFASLIGTGGAARASIAMGQNKKEEAEEIIGNSFTLTLFCAFLLTAITWIAMEPLLSLFGASEAIMPYAREYLRIYSLGNIFTLITVGMNAFLTAQGFTKLSMGTNLIGGILNVILDPIFIFGFDMGAAGAALATILSQGVAAIWVLKLLTGKKDALRLQRKYMQIKSEVISPCIALGLGSFIMMSLESVLTMCFNINLLKYGGDLAVGAMTVINSINQMVTLPIIGFCQGAQPMLSFNFGARKNERVMETFKFKLSICIVYTLIGWILAFLMPETLMRIFSNDVELIQYGARCLKIFWAFLLGYGIYTACMQTFVALGQAKTSLFLILLRKIILQIPLVFILPIFFDDKVFGVFLANPISDIAAGLIGAYLFAKQIKGILEKGPEKKEENIDTKMLVKEA